MNAYDLITVRLKTGDAEVDSLINSIWRPIHGVKIIQAIEDVLVADNFPTIHKDSQSSWTPLNPGYKRRKVRQGYDPEIWKRTGASYKALTTRVPIRIKGGRVAGRTVTITENAGGVVRATHTLERPAASGYFGVVNTKRPWVYITEPARIKITAAISGIFRSEFARAGFKIT